MDFFLASGNAHKREEFERFVRDLKAPICVYDAHDIGGMPEVEEDGSTFRANAEKKARALAVQSPPNSWIVADDSGLCVDALDGEPGVRSACYAGEGGQPANNARLLRELEGVPADKRTAHFRCVLAVCGPASERLFFEGVCHGRIIEEERGNQGFGYDPLFIPDAYDRTFAEMDGTEKDKVSHRARAFGALLEWAQVRFGR